MNASNDLDPWLDELLCKAERAHGQSRGCVVAELLGPYLQRRPDDDHAWFLFGDALRELGLNEEAERALLRSVELAPSPDWVLQVTLAHLYKDTGNAVEAERWFDLAAEDEGASGRGWFWVLRGSNLARHGQFMKAESCFRRAIETGEAIEEGHLNLGYALRSLGRYLEARRHFRLALDASPGYALAEGALAGLDGIESAMNFARQLPKDL
jgi:tetratricopeptide (TPR) repeat protein